LDKNDKGYYSVNRIEFFEFLCRVCEPIVSEHEDNLFDKIGLNIEMLM